MVKKFGVGVIGAGRIGKIHIENLLRKIPDVNLKIVADNKITNDMTQWATEIGVPKLTSNVNEIFLDPDIGVVVIASSTNTHANFIKEAALVKKHIFCEKPIDTDLNRIKETLKIVKEQGVKLMVGYPMRFTEAFINLKKEVELGSLGAVQIAVANHVSTGPFFARSSETIPQPVPSWWFDTKLTGGGSLIDLGCHMIDLLKWYFGEVTDIKGYLGYRYGMDFEDHATCILKFRNGTVGIVNAGWFSTSHRVQVDLFGTANYSSAGSKSPTLFEYAKNVLRRAPSSTFYDELEYFVDCLVSDIQPEPSAEEGLGVQQLIEKVYGNSLSLGA